MGTITLDTITNGDDVDATPVMSNFDAIKNEFNGNIVNANVKAGAGITYSKLALTGGILNADINASAGIVYSKLSLTNGILNADINSSAGIAYSKLNLTGSILNADINASAGITYSKLTLTNGIRNADIYSSAGIVESKITFNTSTGHDHNGTTSKRIPAISSTYFTSLSGANLTSLRGSQVTGLDWDTCWTDAVHTHSSSGEGGLLDWDTCWSDAVHSHASSGEGGTLSGYLSSTGDTMSGNYDCTGYLYAVRSRVTGTAGGGYTELREQSSTPSTPGSGYVKVYVNGSDDLVFRRDDGKSASLNLTAGTITTWH
jgi:hypothetical protein